MHALWASSKVYHCLFSMHRGLEKLGGLTALQRRLQCDEKPRTHCVESKCRNRSIDHVSVSLVVDDDEAVEEFVGQVESLSSLLSWLDADCAWCIQGCRLFLLIACSIFLVIAVLSLSGTLTVALMAPLCLWTSPVGCHA